VALVVDEDLFRTCHAILPASGALIRAFHANNVSARDRVPVSGAARALAPQSGERAQDSVRDRIWVRGAKSSPMLYAALTPPLSPSVLLTGRGSRSSSRRGKRIMRIFSMTPAYDTPLMTTPASC